MREVLERAYDQSPYPDYTFWFTHPDHLAALGTLFGLACPPIAGARVLEIGCASGGNLLSIASSLPGSRCVGVDLSSVQVARAKAHAEAARITNISFYHGDFRELPGDLGPFDFVICHGVYSWVDEATGQALLEFIHAQLAPHGVAYVSYNTYPGWHMVDMVRRLMRLHTVDAPSEDARVEQAFAVTRWLQHRTRVNPNDWRAKALDVELAAMQESGRSLMVHDYLAEFNRPVYFVDFLRNAEHAGLSFLANASPWDMYLENYDPELVQTLGQLGDLVLQQQYLDFAYHTRFRRTLLCRSDAPATRDVRAELTTGFYLGSGMFEDPGLDGIETGLPVQVNIVGRPVLTVSNVILRLALHLIWVHGRAILSFDELVTETAAALRERGLERALLEHKDALERLRGRLAGQILRAFFADAVKYSVHRPPIAKAVPERPATGRYQRYMATIGDYSPNLAHEHFPLAPGPRLVVQHLDGTRTKDELQALHPDPIADTLSALLKTGFILEPSEAAGFV